MKVLIVDDDDAIVEVIKNSVHWDSLEIDRVYTASDSESAKEILSDNEVDIVISDIEMPRESGLELLEWYRENKHTGRFLLLTCHEKFSYAAKAVELGAADYLLKPFNVATMELVLRKNIDILKKEQRTAKSAAFGQWMLENISEMRLTFFESLINGKIMGNRETIEQNIRIRGLEMDPDKKYRLVVSRITNLEQDYEQYGSGTVWFMLKNLHSEILCHTEKNERSICIEQEDGCTVITVCNDLNDDELLDRCTLLCRKCGELLDSTVTSCIGQNCLMEEFQEEVRTLQKILKSNVVFYGRPFFDREANQTGGTETSVLDMKLLSEMFEDAAQKKIMDYIKNEMDSRIHLKVMNERLLKIIRLEFQQAVYEFLIRHGISASRLVTDPGVLAVSEKAENSVLDLLRWANYLTKRAFDAAEELHRSQSLVEQINQFIKEHYKENIGRNEIGQQFHMVPEYLAKIYKKKTGETLKDHINEYRISQAKILLRDTELRVIDIALETGFDNVSYFSTLFRKITGMSPNDFRKNK